ncbi:hypothetical protein LIA77_01402 [Sarocladium implicatum]|nr:hypothetical protein LIA77_01402 [Sarocladium implicatum]
MLLVSRHLRLIDHSLGACLARRTQRTQKRSQGEAKPLSSPTHHRLVAPAYAEVRYRPQITHNTGLISLLGRYGDPDHYALAILDSTGARYLSCGVKSNHLC